MTEIRFAFGENWQSFVATAVDDRRIANAIESLKRLLQTEDLRGLAFLDIGCGSGLFSLAAVMLGAERVVGFDLDAGSVEASRTLRGRADVGEEKWRIVQGSVLDPAFLAGLEPADMVYSWGVLHHTGSMWAAIDAAAGKIRPGGRFALAVYNNVEDFVGGSAMWLRLKRWYNRSPRPVRTVMEWSYGGSLLARKLLRLRSPWRFLREYPQRSGRGMDFWHDVRDWIGGFPYEYATAGEVFRYLHERHGLELTYLDTHDGHGCNEFAFLRPGAWEGASNVTPAATAAQAGNESRIPGEAGGTGPAPGAKAGGVGGTNREREAGP